MKIYDKGNVRLFEPLVFKVRFQHCEVDDCLPEIGKEEDAVEAMSPLSDEIGFS